MNRPVFILLLLLAAIIAHWLFPGFIAAVSGGKVLETAVTALGCSLIG